MNDDQTYALCEAVADIAFVAGKNKYYSGDSRRDIADFIDWAKEFEEQNKGVVWGIDDGYIDSIIDFAHAKIKGQCI